MFRIITDTSARAANLRSHDIQVLDRIASTDLPAISRDTSLRVLKATSIGYQGISINIGNKNGIGKPFENVGTPLAAKQFIRQAFELSARPEDDQPRRLRRHGPPGLPAGAAREPVLRPARSSARRATSPRRGS